MPVKWICDIGSNHNKNYNRMVSLVEAAKNCGCQAVKIQLFRANNLYANGFDKHIKNLFDSEFPPQWLPIINSLCRKANLEFHVTPFDLWSLELAKLYADALKIASYSILDLKLIEAVAEYRKPMAISTGLATPDEINEAFTTARMHNHRVSVYHCAAMYPAPPAVCDLEMIGPLKNKFGNCGWSDHSRKPVVIHYAVALGADAIEFHLDLDGTGLESKYGHCWLPDEIKPVISQTRDAAGAIRIGPGFDFTEQRKWRNDPNDGKRPLKKFRQELSGK